MIEHIQVKTPGARGAAIWLTRSRARNLKTKGADREIVSGDRIFNESSFEAAGRSSTSTAIRKRCTSCSQSIQTNFRCSLEELGDSGTLHDREHGRESMLW